MTRLHSRNIYCSIETLSMVIRNRYTILHAHKTKYNQNINLYILPLFFPILIFYSMENNNSQDSTLRSRHSTSYLKGTHPSSENRKKKKVFLWSSNVFDFEENDPLSNQISVILKKKYVSSIFKKMKRGRKGIPFGS